MMLDAQIKEIYPELTDLDFDVNYGTILLKDDGDGIAYVAKWEYSKPLPKNIKLGKDVEPAAKSK